MDQYQSLRSPSPRVAGAPQHRREPAKTTDLAAERTGRELANTQDRAERILARCHLICRSGVVVIYDAFVLLFASSGSLAKTLLNIGALSEDIRLSIALTVPESRQAIAEILQAVLALSPCACPANP